MTAPSAKNQEEQRTQKDQNAMDVTQYQRERSKLNRETSHYRDLLDFLNKKAMARNNQDMDLVKGYYFTVSVFNNVPADSSIFMLSYCGTMNLLCCFPRMMALGSGSVYISSLLL